MERSTWVSAAKFTTTSAPSIAPATALASQMSPFTNRYPGSSATDSRLARFPAYVSLSSTVTRESGKRSRIIRTKFEPMKPAPPVTRKRALLRFGASAIFPVPVIQDIVLMRIDSVFIRLIVLIHFRKHDHEHAPLIPAALHAVNHARG